MLHILDRNIRIKAKPEKFQDAEEKHDIIFTCEEKVYDQVVERFESGDSSHSHLAHVINIDIVSIIVEATHVEFSHLKMIFFSILYSRLTTPKTRP